MELCETAKRGGDQKKSPDVIAEETSGSKEDKRYTT